MGNEACGCRRSTGYNSNESSVFKPTSIQREWTNAVKNNDIDTVAALHFQNRDLIDLPVDTHNICAIHFAVRHKKYKLLDYLLDNHFDINRQETQNGNTALHFAAENEDTKAIEKLFTYRDIDDKIKNYEGKAPCHMFSDQFKREYIKTKERGKALGNKWRKKMQYKSGYVQHMNTCIESEQQEMNCVDFLSLNEEHESHNKHHNVLNGEYRKKGEYLTKFALENGVDIDEMGMFLQNNINKAVWEKLTNKTEVKTEADVERLLIGICKLTMKEKNKYQNGMKNSENKYNHRASKESIKQLSKSICRIIIEKHGEIILNKADFNKSFHDYLYNVHQQSVNKLKLNDLS